MKKLLRRQASFLFDGIDKNGICGLLFMFRHKVKQRFYQRFKKNLLNPKYKKQTMNEVYPESFVSLLKQITNEKTNLANKKEQSTSIVTELQEIEKALNKNKREAIQLVRFVNCWSEHPITLRIFQGLLGIESIYLNKDILEMLSESLVRVEFYDFRYNWNTNELQEILNSPGVNLLFDYVSDSKWDHKQKNSIDNYFICVRSEWSKYLNDENQYFQRQIRINLKVLLFIFIFIFVYIIFKQKESNIQ